MKRITDIIKKVESLNINFFINTILKDSKIQGFILDLNRENQLFNQGIDANKKKLKTFGASITGKEVYAAKTILIKEAKGQPTDRVTLKDTGAFYESFKIIINEMDFEISANTMKDGTDLMDYGEILGLTDESLQLLIEKIKALIVPMVLNRVLG
jgi:hypothetical protein